LLGIEAFDEADRLLRRVHQRHPSNFFLLQMLGILSVARQLAAEQGSFDETIGYFQAARAMRGNNPATNLFLSQVYKAQGKWDDALRAARAGIEADPQSAPAHHNLGMLYSELKEWDKALECYRRAADLDPVSALPYDALGQTYYQKGVYDRALDCYDVALKREPAFVGVYVNKGNALDRKNDLDGAIRYYKKALDLFPNYGLAHNNLGLAYGKNNDYPRALACLRTAIECDPYLVKAYYDLGNLLLLVQKDPEAAIKAYEGPVARFPKLPQPHFQLADLYLRLGRPFQAAEVFRKVIALQPTFPEAHARLANALAALGQWDGAIDAYQTALAQLGPSAAAFEKATLLNQLGAAHAKKGEWDKAVSRHQEALKLDPLRGQVQANLGAAYRALWRCEEAADAFRAALAQDAGNALLHYELASVLMELGDLDNTILHARKALEIAPRHPEPYSLLARAYMEQGEVAKCLEAARQGKELLNPLEPDVANVQLVYHICEQLGKGDELYPAVLRGEAKPADVVERNCVAMVAGVKHKKYAAAARLFAESFAADPLRANDVAMGGRYRGACFALRAGTGGAEKEAALKDEDKAQFRQQALDWLRADLAAWKRIYQSALPTGRTFPVFRVRLLLKDPALESMRAPALAKLPAAERAAWERFWADVQAFVAPDPSGTRSGPDLAALRKLAHLPGVSMGFDIQYNSGPVKRDARGNILVPQKEIARLLAELKDTPRDGERLLDLASWYSDLKDEAKAQDTARQAEQLLRPYLKTSDPKDSRRLVEYSRAHNFFHPTLAKEREAWLRRAVELNPNDWRAWIALGCCYQQQMHLTVLGGRFAATGKPNEAKEWLHAGKVTGATVNEVEKLLGEARKCAVRAKKLAPTEEKQWDFRVCFLLEEIEWLNGFQVARGQPPLPVEIATPEWQAKGYKGGISLAAAPDLLAELCEAAERCPEHIGMQFLGMVHVLPRVRQRTLARDPLKDKSPLLTLRESQFFDDTLARLRKIGQKAQGEAALYCDRVQAVLLMQLLAMDQGFARGLGQVESILRRIMEADPQDANASLLLEMLVTDQGNPEAGLQLARQRVARNPSTQNRYTLARALEHCGKTEEAAKQVETALAQAPEDIYLLAGSAALWVRHGDKEDLRKAGEYLDKARARVGPSDPPSLAEDIEYLQGIQRVLSGQEVIGRLTLDILRTRHPQDKRFVEALQLLEP
jgi:tetratricopeptide (TPR) repeat protein